LGQVFDGNGNLRSMEDAYNRRGYSEAENNWTKSLLNKQNSNNKKRDENMVFNVEIAIKTLNKNALLKSSGYCAKYVRLSLEAGGIKTNNRPGSAKDYDSFLKKKGFYAINSRNYIPLRGDIVVMEAFMGAKKNHPHGHIQMYNGTQWVSDFRQKAFWPGSDYRNYKPDYTILRW
jgi:hypothetical protein